MSRAVDTTRREVDVEIPPNIDEKAHLYFQNIADSISFVFKSLLSINVRQKKLYARRLHTLPKDIIIRINYHADLRGYFAYFISLDTCFEICGRLVPNMDRLFFDSEHLDLIGELGNMISGNTIGKLQSVDADINLTAPSLAGFHEILSAERSHWIFSSNFDADVGKLGVLLGIEKPQEPSGVS